MIGKLSPKQRQLATWWAEGTETSGKGGVIAEGAIRSGKTHALTVGFLLWSQRRFSGRNFILAGRSVGALKRNVVMPMLGILRDLGWPYTFNRSEGFVEVGTNTYHLFGASNEASQDMIQGLTAAGCLADEAALFPKSFVDQMVARCSVEGAKLWFDCNPSYPTHPFKTEWVDRADDLGLLHLQFRMGDNPSLSEETKARYESMFTGVFYDRYILGLWTLAEGLVYPDHAKAFEQTFEGKARDWRVSCDYGTQNAFAALLWAYDGEVWHCVKEYRYSGRDEGHQKTDQDYVRDMRAFLGDVPSDTPFIIDPSAASFIAAMRRAGFKVRKARNDVMDGIRETAACMQCGDVRLSEECRELKKEFAGYVWDEKAQGDRPVKENDHLMDALRYFVATERVYNRREQYTSPFQIRVR